MATVYVMPLMGSVPVESAIAALARNKAELRHRVANELTLKYAPDLRFRPDETLDNVALPLRVSGQAPSSYSRDVMDLLDWVGLKKQAHAFPAVLSGGEKQRAAIARAVIAKPELLLADEPTGNVDPVLARRLIHLFAELNRLGTTVLLATHDQGLFKQVRAPVLHLQDGTLRML